MASRHHFYDCAALTPCYLRSLICSLYVSSTIADWQSEFLSLFCWQNDAYLVTFLVYMYPAFEGKGRYMQDKKCSNGACRSENLQCGAFAGRPGAVGRLGQRRTGCRPWPGHGGHGSHTLADCAAPPSGRFSDVARLSPGDGTFMDFFSSGVQEVYGFVVHWRQEAVLCYHGRTPPFHKCLSQIFQLFRIQSILLIHVLGRCHLHVHAVLLVLCSNSWSEGPTERSVPKVGFPVRPKICVLSQS